MPPVTTCPCGATPNVPPLTPYETVAGALPVLLTVKADVAVVLMGTLPKSMDAADCARIALCAVIRRSRTWGPSPGAVVVTVRLSP